MDTLYQSLVVFAASSYEECPSGSYDYSASGATDSAAVMAFLTPLLLFFVVLAIISIIGTWKVYTKAGKPGWACLIPVYREIVLAEIVGRPVWWGAVAGVASFIPLAGIVSLVFYIIMFNDLAKSFGRSTGTTVGLILINPVMMMILGFGKSAYQGPSVAPALGAQGQPVNPLTGQPSAPPQQQAQQTTVTPQPATEQSQQPNQPVNSAPSPAPTAQQPTQQPGQQDDSGQPPRFQ